MIYLLTLDEAMSLRLKRLVNQTAAADSSPSPPEIGNGRVAGKH